MFNTGNPENDAIVHINWIDKQPSMLAEQASCDLCGIKHDLIDMIVAPDKGGYYCQGCLDCGDVESYLCRCGDLTKEQIINYLDKIKL